MADYTELLSSLPIDDIARRLGTDPETARAASAAAIPALLGGLQANAADPAGKASLVGALGQHDPKLVQGGVDLGDVDVADGEKVVRNVFGPKKDEVATKLGASQGVGSDLFAKLLPILAPIVLSYLTNKVLNRSGQGQAAPRPGGQSGGGMLGDLLGSILGGGRGSATPAPSGRTGSAGPGGLDITDVLGDLLGGGSSAPTQQGRSAGGVEDLLGSVLGGLLGGGRR